MASCCAHWPGTAKCPGARKHCGIRGRSVTCFALFWMLAALVVMLRATRRCSRREWLCGSVLLGIVIVKLMLVDSAAWRRPGTRGHVYRRGNSGVDRRVFFTVTAQSGEEK